MYVCVLAKGCLRGLRALFASVVWVWEWRALSPLCLGTEGRKYATACDLFVLENLAGTGMPYIVCVCVRACVRACVRVGGCGCGQRAPFSSGVVGVLKM